MTLAIDKDHPSSEIVSRAAECLASGQLVVYPTDTAYGLGADATNMDAVDKLYALKGRTLTKPTHVIVRDWQMITELCVVSEAAEKLFKSFMPGPLTMVLPSKDPVAPKLGAGTDTLGVRMPDCQFTLALSQAVDFPYTTPSANKAGGATPYSVEAVDLDLARVGMVVDAGALPKVLPSTVVDLTGATPRVVREGPISESEILAVLASI